MLLSGDTRKVANIKYIDIHTKLNEGQGELISIVWMLIE